MSGVYNRKLFRQSGARDELRKMGGIMSSSEELMRAALMTGMQAPGPADLGPMPMPQQPVIGMPAPPVMQPQQPMAEPQQPMDMGMQQPMGSGFGMQQPMDMGMQQPMDSGYGMQPSQPMMQQQPIQPPIAEPAYMPPQMPQSLQMPQAQPPGFFLGGLINLAPTMGSAEASEDPAAPPAPAARPNPARAIGIGPSTVRSAEPVDIGATAGTVVVPPKVNAIGVDAFVERIGAKLDTASPEEVGDDIVKTAVEEPTGDLRFDLAKTLEEMTGDLSAYEKDIDTLNRGIIGAAIAAGTSARATENIAKGMLVGMESVKATEERRAADAQALQLKALEVRAAEQAAREAEIKAEEKAKTEAKAKLAEDVRSAYSRARDSIIESGINNVGKLPDGMTLTEYAESFGRSQAEATYGKEAVDAILGTPAAPQSTLSAEDKAELLNEAKVKIGKNPALRTAVRDRLSKDFGITPEELDAVLGGS